MRMLLAGAGAAAAPAWPRSTTPCWPTGAGAAHPAAASTRLAAETAALAAGGGAAPAIRGRAAVAAYQPRVRRLGAGRAHPLRAARRGRAGFAIAFWPDARGATPRALAGWIAAADPGRRRPRGASRSVGRGARALRARRAARRPDAAPVEGYACELVAAIARDLAATAAQAADALARPLRRGAAHAAGAPDNARYLDGGRGDARRSTARCCRGWSSPPTCGSAGRWATFDAAAAAPRRGLALRAAAARRAAGDRGGAGSLRDRLRAGTDRAGAGADTDVFERGAGRRRQRRPDRGRGRSVGGRLRLEILAQQAVRWVSDQLEVEIGPALGIAAGFNSMDGD